MSDNLHPRLRNVDKGEPPYPLNEFSNEFCMKLGKEIVYLLATKGTPSLEGSEWEKIFAYCIGAVWKPSNIGLDDVIFGNTAWGAKTIKSSRPSNQKIIRLISGRNSPVYSYGDNNYLNKSTKELGEKILAIWNERVASIRNYFRNLRTVVLMKSNDLCELGVFEFDTVLYDADSYEWKWNEHKNLLGFRKKDKFHAFTWQPHGSQFTIIEKVPDNATIINIKPDYEFNEMQSVPNEIKDMVLRSIQYKESWIHIRKNNG